MRKISVLLIGFALSGCSGLGEYISDTFWPMHDAEAPIGQSETFRRVRGETVGDMPLVVQEGDIWPGQPDPVPTIQDVSNPDSRFSRSFRHSLQSLDNDLEEQLRDNETLVIGEEAMTETGVHRRSTPVVKGALPSSIPDNAQQYFEGPNRDTITIPNEDGTVTLVAPDGSVRVVRNNPEVTTRNQGKVHTSQSAHVLRKEVRENKPHSVVKKSPLVVRGNLHKKRHRRQRHKVVNGHSKFHMKRHRNYKR